MNSQTQNMLVDLAVRVGGALVNAGLTAASSRAETEAVILAELRASPPADVARDYAAAREAVLGDDEGDTES